MGIFSHMRHTHTHTHTHPSNVEGWLGLVRAMSGGAGPVRAWSGGTGPGWVALGDFFLFFLLFLWSYTLKLGGPFRGTSLTCLNEFLN